MAERNLQINMKIGLSQAKSSLNSFKGSLKSLRGAFSTLGRVGSRAIDGIKRKLQGLRGISNLVKSSLRAVFRTGVVAGFFFAFRAGMQTITNLKETIASLAGEFANLRLKATETAAIISGGGTAFASTFEEALSLARELSTEIGFTAQQIQEGLVTAARSGLTLTDSFSLTSSALMLATANGEEFQTTLNDLIGVSRAFNVELEDMGTFADALSAAVTQSNVSLSGLFAGLKKVAPVAGVAFGSSAETIADTTAALMTLNDTGMQSERAGTGLRAAMQKLLGGTGRTTTAFAKYGINMFKANGESQKYLDTLLKAQKATDSTEQKINKLKNAEMELLIAGKQNTSAFQEIQKELGDTDSYLNTLKKGLDTVYQSFTLAGGKLKPFSDVLTEISAKAPTEVVGRAFGIRGGAPMTQILQNIEKFKKFKAIVEESQKASQEGTSLTKDMYMKFLDTVLIGWQRIKNTSMAILSTIADGFFEAVKPLIGPVQNVLTDIFQKIDMHKDSFKKIFMGVSKLLLPLLAQMQIFGQGFANSLDGITDPSSIANVPVLRPNGDGKIKVEYVKIEGTVPEKLKKAFKLLGESFINILRASLKKLDGAFKFLAEVFADGFAIALEAKSMMLMNIGSKIGGGMAVAFGKALIKAIPELIAAFGNVTKDLKLPEEWKLFGMSFKTPFGNNALNAVAGKKDSEGRLIKGAPEHAVNTGSKPSVGALDWIFPIFGLLKTTLIAINENAVKTKREELGLDTIADAGKTDAEGSKTTRRLGASITPDRLDFTAIDSAGQSLKDSIDSMQEGTAKLNDNAIRFANGVYTNKKAIENTNRLVNQIMRQK